MTRVLLGLGLMTFGFTAAAAQEPSCQNCPATYVGNEELQAYVEHATASRITDQQIRAVDVGKSNVDIGVHQDRRPHHVSDDQGRPRQGHAAQRRGGLELGEGRVVKD